MLRGLNRISSNLSTRTLVSVPLHPSVQPRSFSTSLSFLRSKMAQPQDTSVNKTAHPFERASLESLCIRRFFYAPAFEIYGGE